MNRTILIEPLTAEAFAPFGDVLSAEGPHDKLINAGLCQRFHDRARLDFGPDGRAGISIFQAELRSLPYTLDLMERHPEGSQAFFPLCDNGFLVTVAEDQNGHPATPRAFLTQPQQGVNFLRNTWHGVLTPLAGSGCFAVIDWIGDTPNLEEYRFDAPYHIKRSETVA